jgi:hypothetical protein
MIYDSDQHNTQNLSSMMDLFFRNLNGGNESGQKRFLRGAGSGDDDALRGLGRPEADDGVEAAPDDARRRIERFRGQLDVAQLKVLFFRTSV